MVVHVLVDVAEEAGGDDADAAEGDAGQVDVLVALGVGEPAGGDDGLVGDLVAVDAGDVSDAVEEGGAGELDGVGDGGDVGDVEAGGHGAADVVFGVGDEFGDEDVVVCGVADGAADDADGEGQGGDGGDQVVGADDGRHDGGGDDDAADAQAREHEEAPHLVEVIRGGRGQATAAGRHQHGRDDHELLVVAAEHAEQAEHDAGAGDDGQADGEAADADADGVVAVHVEGLRRPEHDHRDEVGAGDEGDDEGKGEDERFLLQPGWEHGVLGPVKFPGAEDHEQSGP